LATHSLFNASAVLYDFERDRCDAIKVFLDKAIHRHLSTIEAKGFRTDGSYEVLCGDVYTVCTVAEYKNDLATARCDPSHQGGFNYRAYYMREQVRIFLLMRVE
jgi:hypothetical protein